MLELITVMAHGRDPDGDRRALLQYMTTANRIAAEVNGLIGDMQFARAEASRRAPDVVACASTNGVSCNNTNTWQNGWVVCSDVNNDGTCDAGDPVYRVQKAFTSTDTFTASGNTTTLTVQPRRICDRSARHRDDYAAQHARVSQRITRCLAISAVGTLACRQSGTGNCT